MHRAGVVVLVLAVLCASSSAGERLRPRTDLRAHTSAVQQVRFHADGKLLASVGAEGAVFIWDTEQRTVVRRIQPIGREVTGARQMAIHPRRVESMAMAPQGDLMIDAAEESPAQGTVRLWNTATGEAVQTFAEQVRNVRAVAYSPTGTLVAANMRPPREAAHQIVLYNPESGATVGTLKADRLAATALMFSPDGTRLVSAGGSTVYIWDVEQRKLLHRIDAHRGAVRAIRIAPDGTMVASAGADALIRLWSMEDGSRKLEIKSEQEGVNDVAFSASGKTLASAGDDRTIKLWDPTSGQLMNTLWHHLDRVLSLAFSPDGKTLASGSSDQTIALWNFEDPKPEPGRRPRRRDRGSGGGEQP